MRPVIALITLLVVGCTTPSAHLRMREADAGFENGTFSELDHELLTAVREGEVPGAVLAVARNGQLSYEHALGVRSGDGAPMKPETLFDVASLTKPVATSAAAAALMCDGILEDSRVVGDSTVGELLIHQSTLPQYARWEDLETRRSENDSPADAIFRWLDKSAPAPHRHSYSNLGFILVAGEIENLTGQPLETYLRERLWGPMEMNNTTFRPETLEGALIAQTSGDTGPGQSFDPLADWVKERFPGHDPGHSGLFSTARDLTMFCQSLLHAEESAIEGLECIARMMMEPPVLPSENAGSGMAQFGDAARSRGFETITSIMDGPFYYHTGYTGCILWMNRKTGVSVVLMTNSSLTDPAGWETLRNSVLKIVNKGTTRPRSEELYDPAYYTPGDDIIGPMSFGL